MANTDRSKIVSMDFIFQKQQLDTLLYNDTLFKKTNDNDKLKRVLPLAFLFNSYYNGEIDLLSKGLYSSAYSVARSALECFANFSMLCEYFDSPLFLEKYKILLKKDILQIFKIAELEEDEKEKNFLMNTVVLKIREAEIDDLAEGDNAKIEDIIKNIRKEINNCEEYKTTNLVLKSLDYLENVYGDNTKFAKTIYAELCNLSHNNISGIAERFYKDIEGKFGFCGEHYTAGLITPTQEMFIACGKYIERWIKNNILTVCE